MSNVIHNAMRYSPAGGKIEISLASDGADAVLRIRDHGGGVASNAPDGGLLMTLRLPLLLDPEP